MGLAIAPAHVKDNAIIVLRQEMFRGYSPIVRL